MMVQHIQKVLIAPYYKPDFPLFPLCMHTAYYTTLPYDLLYIHIFFQVIESAPLVGPRLNGMQLYIVTVAFEFGIWQLHFALR